MYGFCQLYRHFSPLISSTIFCTRWGISCGAKGATKILYNNIVVGARGIKSKMHTHIYIHYARRGKAASEIERVTLLMTFIIMPSVCVGERGIFAARMQHNKKHLPPTVMIPNVIFYDYFRCEWLFISRATALYHIIIKKKRLKCKWKAAFAARDALCHTTTTKSRCECYQNAEISPQLSAVFCCCARGVDVIFMSLYVCCNSSWWHSQRRHIAALGGKYPVWIVKQIYLHTSIYTNIYLIIMRLN